MIAGGARHASPHTSIAILAAALAIVSSPVAGSLLEDRELLTAPGGMLPEIWRPLSGHLVHGSASHLLGNVLVLAPLLVWRERRVKSRRLALECAFLAATVALGVRTLHDGWTSYRGLSGITYGMLAIFLSTASRSATTDGEAHPPRRLGRRAGVVALAMLGVKTLVELAHGGWIVDGIALTDALGVVYLPASHLAGLAAGAVLVLTERFEARRHYVHGTSNARATAHGSSDSSNAAIVATP